MHFKAHFSLVLLLLATFYYKDAVARGVSKDTEKATIGSTRRNLVNRDDSSEGRFATQLLQLKGFLGSNNNNNPAIETTTITESLTTPSLTSPSGGSLTSTSTSTPTIFTSSYTTPISVAVAGNTAGGGGAAAGGGPAAGGGAGPGGTAATYFTDSYRDESDFDEDSVDEFGGKKNCNGHEVSDKDSNDDEVRFDDASVGRQTILRRPNNRARRNTNRRRQATRRANAQRRRRQAARRRAQNNRKNAAKRRRNSQLRRIRQDSINRKRRRDLSRRGGRRNLVRRVIV